MRPFCLPVLSYICYHKHIIIVSTMNYPFLEIAPSSKTRRFWSQGRVHNLSFFTPEFLFTRTPACKTVTAHTTTTVQSGSIQPAGQQHLLARIACRIPAACTTARITTPESLNRWTTRWHWHQLGTITETIMASWHHQCLVWPRA
jgi:hypothetical protein